MPAASGSASGPKPFSISLGSKTSAHARPPRLTKRPHSSLAGDGSDAEDDDAGKAELVLGFDNGGATTVSKTTETQGPLIIGGQKNRDWKEEAERKKGRNLLPEEEQVRRAGGAEIKDIPHNEPDAERSWGLIVTKRAQHDEGGGAESEGRDDQRPNGEMEKAKPQTADEEALAALLGKEKKDSGLVIPHNATSNDRFAPRITEGDVFRADVSARPDAASLAAYGAIPVEDFGRALMRGMGWKEGMEVGRNKSQVIKEKAKKEERRVARLGIGAKELPQELAEPGAWGQGARKGKKELSTYTPLLLKNNATGETMTEEEYKNKQETQILLLDDSKADKNEYKNSSSRSKSSKDRDRHRDDRERPHRHDHSEGGNRGSRYESHRDHERCGDNDHRDRKKDHSWRERDCDRDRRDRSREDHGDRHRHHYRRGYRDQREDARHRDDKYRQDDRRRG